MISLYGTEAKELEEERRDVVKIEVEKIFPKFQSGKDPNCC